jgi:hypothetical protein
MKSILTLACLCLAMGCVKEQDVHSSTTSFEVVCYNSSTDCAVESANNCGLRGFQVLDIQVRPEGRAGDDGAAIRIVQRVICNPPHVSNGVR